MIGIDCFSQVIIKYYNSVAINRICEYSRSSPVARDRERGSFLRLGRPSGQVQQRHWHLVRIGDAVDVMDYFVKYVLDTN